MWQFDLGKKKTFHLGCVHLKFFAESEDGTAVQLPLLDQTSLWICSLSQDWSDCYLWDAWWCYLKEDIFWSLCFARSDIGSADSTFYFIPLREIWYIWSTQLRLEPFDVCRACCWSRTIQNFEWVRPLGDKDSSCLC